MIDSDIQQIIDQFKQQQKQELETLSKQTELLQNRIIVLEQFNVPTVINAISQHNLRNLMTVVAPVFLQGSAGQTAANYGVFFIADRGYQITGVSEVHGTPSSSGTVNVNKTANLSGVDTTVLSSAFSTAATSGVSRFGTLINNTGSDVLSLAKGDRLHLVNSGTLTSLVDLFVIVYLRPI